MKPRGAAFANQPRASSGFTLVELMVAMVLGLLLTAAVMSMFIANKRTYRSNNMIAAMQDNARFAMQALAGDLAMAGFFGGITDRGRIEMSATQMPALTQDCGPGADGVTGWAFDTAALGFVDEGAAATTTFSCLSAADLADGSDVVSVHSAGVLAGVLDNDSATPGLALDANTFYLRSNRTTGELFYSGSSATDAPGSRAPSWYWRYSGHLYFVRPYSETAGDGIPTLCRVYIDHGGQTVAIERVAKGVEILQIAFGIDSDDDGVANRYRINPSADQLADAVTARITLLMRSTEPDRSYTNDKTYDLPGYDDDSDGSVDEDGEGYTPSDHYYRRLLQTTVILRNASLTLGSAT